VHAEAFIRAKCSTPLTVADIATAVGVSIRKLQTAFVNHRSLSPGQYLAKVRLEKAHHLLSNPHDTSVNVTSVAYDCGIMHLGRFSRAYLYTYGEYPSQTLANARRKH
jgi:transcriptional regulator GlxA family with amidase domain